MSEFVVDMTHLAAFGKKLRAESAELEKEFHAGLAGVGELVASEVRRNARSFPRQYGGTDRIAQSVKVKRRLTTVKVTAGGDGAPEAAPIEHGGLGGKFRHPLFGHDPWYPQQSFPFMTDAARTMAPVIEDAIQVVVDLAIARLVI